MRTKLTILITLLVFGSVTAFGQQNNAPEGSVNIYENLYGTTQGVSRAAMDAVVFIDYVIQPDFVIAGLTNLGYTVTVATGWADFDTKLVSGNYGLAVGFIQNQGATGPSPAAMQTFIGAGGCIIYADWYMDNARVSPLEASFTGSANNTVMTISDPILAGGLTNPVIMTNTGWGTFTMGLTATGSAQVLATFENGDAAVVRGNGGKSIVLGYLSDVPFAPERQQLFENVVLSTLCGSGLQVPVSDWAIYLGLFLMISFVVFRFARAS